MRDSLVKGTDWSVLATAAGLGALWWLLTDGAAGSWLLGVPVVAAAAWSVRRLRPAGTGSLSLPGILRFVPFFLAESVRGGVDVALRTLAPRMRISPGFIDYRVGLARRDARVFFTNCVCLLPGTLALEQREDSLRLHLLDASRDATSELRRLEQAVARIYV